MLNSAAKTVANLVDCLPETLMTINLEYLRFLFRPIPVMKLPRGLEVGRKGSDCVGCYAGLRRIAFIEVCEVC